MRKLDEIAKNIRLAIFDVDGVLTDGQLIFSDHGVEIKAFHAHDGLGIKLLLQAGIEVAIITSRESTIVKERMRQLGVRHVYQGQKNKMHAYVNLLEKLNLNDNQVAYMGDDLPDLCLIQRAGLGVVPSNANEYVSRYADWQTHKLGGQGAVREFCEYILKSQDKLTLILNTFHQKTKKQAIA